MLRALPPHLIRPPKRKRRTAQPTSRPRSPLSLPPMSSPDPEKSEDPDRNAPSAQVVRETEATPPEETTPTDSGSSVPSALDQKVSALEDKIDAMQTKLDAFEKETEVLKEKLTSFGDQLVALEKVTRASAPSLHNMIVDEIHQIILASQTLLLTCINTYVLGPVQKLKF